MIQSVPFCVIPACAHAEHSNARLGAGVRYRLLANAIDTSTGLTLAHTLSESFHVSFCLPLQGPKQSLLIWNVVTIIIITITILLLAGMPAGLRGLPK